MLRPLPAACHAFNPTWDVHNLGDMNILCPSCRALHWKAEHLINSSNINPKFGMCCYSGKISLPLLEPALAELYGLLTGQNPSERAFCSNTHNYNSALAMTSVGRKVDESTN